MGPTAFEFMYSRNCKRKQASEVLLASKTGYHFNYQIMRLPSHTTLIDIDDLALIDIGNEIRLFEGGGKWSNFVDGKDGFFYGIPSDARRV
jgi:hypothetical protein